MRLGVDVMGGDNAPDEILKGCIAALPKLAANDELVLYGDRRVIDETFKERGIRDPRVTVVATTEVIGMDESPVEAIRSKRDASMVVMTKDASPKTANRLDAIMSAGNTGAMVSASQMHMRRIPNVVRPGIAVTVPTFAGPVVLIDVGANIEPKPVHLAQYGVMGAIYARISSGIANPRVAIMNVGGEEAKGTDDMRLARDMLRGAHDLNFTGFVEGRGVFNGEADVVITDGVVGNVMIKLAEGLASGIFKALAREVLSVDPELAARLEPVVKSLYAKHDYHEFGGAPLLGVNGIALISHGSSVARTVMNAITRMKTFAASKINTIMSEELGRLRVSEEVSA
ncbi:MAG: phosphate acyltransferase PlsX [Planctomycetes bacterium]|nr:phosphate acyltransferase PlsX [Planctomycetota bacterium]